MAKKSPSEYQKADSKIFGTDGVRGEANAHPITAEQILGLAQAIGSFAVQNNAQASHKCRVIIGKDTRLSGYMLEPALTAGLIGCGCDVFLLGPLPTPAVAMLTKSLRADIGIMISASHNPYSDNGIKIFRHNGFKLNNAEEAQIESLLQNPQNLTRAPADKLGRAKRLESARGRYVEYVKATFPAGLRLEGLKIVVDCAHGAAYKIAPDILYELGAEVIPLGVQPDGFNINDGCGALTTEPMCRAVLEHKADLGIALDGDADRVILCDRQGRLLNGDKILAVIASYYKKHGRLTGAVIGTVMANLALDEYLQAQNIEFHRTPVGDRNITAALLDKGCNLGGEQSGHIIIGDYGYGGDGLLAALQVLAACIDGGGDLSVLHDIFTAVPQKIINLPLMTDKPVQKSALNEAIAEAEAQLGDSGRILVRLSGTEPVIRLMGEARNEKLLAQTLQILQDRISGLL